MASRTGARGSTHSSDEPRTSSANMSANKRADALETALESLGPFGLYQKYMLIMLCIPNIMSAMYGLNYIFVAETEAFRCVVPECEGYSPEYSNNTVSSITVDSCNRYAPIPNSIEDSCSRDAYHLNDTIACDTFAYATTNSIYSEFNLACREWMRTMVGTVRNSALPVALLLTGFVSDKYGRRTAFCIFSSFAAVMGIIKAFSVNYQMYLALEFLEAALGYGFNGAAYVMIVELARPAQRAAFACATGIAYGLGGILFSILAWQIQYWRHLLLTIHSFALLLPFYWYLIDESPRWLHANMRDQETEKVIRNIARWNKIAMKDETIQDLHTKDDDKGEKAKPLPNPWLSLLRSKVLLLRWAACAWCWVAVAFVYYGLTINSVSLSGDKYMNFALNMAMEIVASVLIMMALERFGRKWSIFAAFLMCAVACITPFYVNHTGTSLGMFFLGKLSITFAFNSIYVFTAELFPTRVRSSALSACSLIGRIGSILAPQTPLLSVTLQAALYGASCATAALAICAVPETRRAHLPADVSTAETLKPVQDIEAMVISAISTSRPSALYTRTDLTK